VSDAPNLDPDAALSEEEEQTLFAHYGEQRERDKGDPFEEGIVRSEEEVEVRAGEMQPAERVRLKKVLVTEDQKVVVPRRKEVVQLDTEPLPEGEVEHVDDAAPDDRPGERPV
jgi:hypothetical protein